MTCVELELHNWDKIQRRDKLVGCSLTGWQDMVNATNMTKEKEATVLRMLRKAAHEEAKAYAKEIEQNGTLTGNYCKARRDIKSITHRVQRSPLFPFSLLYKENKN